MGYIDDKQRMSKKRRDVYINEVGSAMVSAWHKFLPNSKSIIFVVDITNTVQLANSLVEFFNVIYGHLLTSNASGPSASAAASDVVY